MSWALVLCNISLLEQSGKAPVSRPSMISTKSLSSVNISNLSSPLYMVMVMLNKLACGSHVLGKVPAGAAKG